MSRLGFAVPLTWARVSGFAVVSSVILDDSLPGEVALFGHAERAAAARPLSVNAV